MLGVRVQRCGSIPFFGRPKAVSTVDRYQGQQNDFILLSLVRTKNVGHLRDVRRLVVAVRDGGSGGVYRSSTTAVFSVAHGLRCLWWQMSRSRFGLYVFCRKRLFTNCYELTPTFSQLVGRSTDLQLVLNESYPATRLVRPTGVGRRISREPPLECSRPCVRLVFSRALSR